MKYWAVIFWGLLLILSAGADWPEFRGPQRSGMAADKGLPRTWNGVANRAEGAENENVIWKQRLPGPGASSPITWKGRIFVTCYSGYGVDAESPGELQNLKLHLLCLDAASGEFLWDRSQPAEQPEQEFTGDFTMCGYASSTPVTDGKAVYAFFGRSGVFAYDLSGIYLWHASVGTGTNGWGTGASPILYDNLVIVNASMESRSIVALDKISGHEVWRTAGGTLSWSTPALVPLPGNRRELIVSVDRKVLGLDPATGEKLWECAADGAAYSSPCVVVDGERNEKGAYVIIGRGRTTMAIRPGGTGDVSKTHLLWHIKKGSFVATPLYRDGLLCWVDDRGIASCISARDGKLLHEVRLTIPGEGPKVYASPVMADDKLYAVTRQGGTLVFAPNENLEELARNALGDKSICNATPAIWEGKLLLRSNEFLYCIGQQ